MSHRPYDGRTGLRALTGLDLGLRVRVSLPSAQRTIFCGSESLSARELIAELAQMISGLRVYSYALRGQLETVTYALQANAECRSWRYAQRAALDLAGLLVLARKRRLADAERCVQGADVAARIVELCSLEVR